MENKKLILEEKITVAVISYGDHYNWLFSICMQKIEALSPNVYAFLMIKYHLVTQQQVIDITIGIVLCLYCSMETLIVFCYLSPQKGTGGKLFDEINTTNFDQSSI